MSDPSFFGYGSLVNVTTHSYANPRPYSVTGWRRIWQATPLRDTAFLSVHSVADAELHGLVADVPGADWSALDQRETGYRRRQLEPTLAIYQAATPIAATPNHHLLLSYIDVVAQGYARVFGPQGPTHFFATTDGWTLPVINDRAMPRYPRHQPQSVETMAMVDTALAALSVQVKPQ